MIVSSICLTDIPKEKITTGKNGKKYISIVTDNRREPDQYGNTHTVYINQSKEERESKQTKQYVGNGKEYLFNNTTSAPQATYGKVAEISKAVAPKSFVQNQQDDDLPF